MKKPFKTTLDLIDINEKQREELTGLWNKHKGELILGEKQTIDIKDLTWFEDLPPERQQEIIDALIDKSHGKT